MNIEMIEAANTRLDGFVRRTPLLSSPFLDEIAGRQVLVKPECLQHTGSFKFRGAWSAISALAPKQRAKGIIAFSSGNHAQGVAHAAREHGTKSIIVMPRDAPALKIANTRALGAEVVLYDRASQDREAIGAQLAKDRDLTLIKPYDNEHVIAGQGTIGLEIAAQCGELGVTSAAVLVPCGGGGLTSGIALSLADQAPDMVVHPVEPLGFDDVARSLSSGKRERNTQAVGSICDAIITPSPGVLTFPILQRLCGAGLVVSDDDCLGAMALAFNHLKLVPEPGGAAGLAAALFHSEKVNADTVVVVISGGNVDGDIFRRALAGNEANT
ncbi:MAG: threonine/serine dehydratase [Paracoccaceae bacterium]